MAHHSDSNESPKIRERFGGLRIGETHLAGPGRPTSVFVQVSVSFHLIGKQENYPGVGGARSAQCLVTMVPVLKEVLAVVMRHQQRRGVPPVLDAVLHCLDVGLPDPPRRREQSLRHRRDRPSA